jgi:ATP-dependent Lon protease
LRLQHVTHVLTKQLSIAEVSTKIATAVDESLSKQQKALFLRQQLAAINAELQRLEPVNTDLHGSGNIAEDEDDLDVLVRRVDALPAGSEVRRVASTEARRLRRIPPQNAEHGVVRNYVSASFFLSLSHVSCLTLRSARMAYRSALDPTATWLGYSYEDRLPPQRKVATRCGPLWPR